MLDQFYTGFADTHTTALKQYCKMENILPLDLVRTSRPKSTMKRRLRTTAFHLLQRIDKWLNIMISRLSPEMDRSAVVHGRLS